MPSNPTVRDVHPVDRPLTNISIAYSQDPANAIAPRVFPMVPVTNKSDSYFEWDRGDFNRDDAKAMAAGEEYPVGVKRLSTGSYNCKVYKYSEMIADEERGNADSPLDLDMTATENVTRKHMIRRDRQWAADNFTTGKWTGSTTGGDIVPANKWDDYTLGTPIVDIRKEVRSLTKRGLKRANIKLVLPPPVWDALQDHPDFLERYENTRDAIMTEALVARVLGIGEVIVAESVFNSAPEGAPTVDEFILNTNDALLVYSAPAPALNAVSGGYTFVWTGLNGAAGLHVRKIRRDPRDSDQILSRSAFDTKLVAAQAGVFFNNVLT